MSLGVGSKLKKNRFHFPRCIGGRRVPDPQANRIRKRKNQTIRVRNGWAINDAGRLHDA